MLPCVLWILFILCEATRVTTTAESENWVRDEHLVTSDIWASPNKERDGSTVVSEIGIIHLGERDNLLLQVERWSFVVAAILMSITMFILVSVTIAVHYKHGGGYYNYEAVSQKNKKEL